MKIAVLGTGDVGRALAAGFLGLKHDVIVGTRDPGKAKIKKWLREAGPRACAGTFAEAAAAGDVAVLATAWEGTRNAIRLAGPDNLAGKVVLDITNPISSKRPWPALDLGNTDSGGEQVQRWLPKAKVVKTLNHIGAAQMVRPRYREGKTDIFLCGKDAKAKALVARFLKGFGHNPIDLGGIEMARLLEALTALWVQYGYVTGIWSHAFKVLKK